MKYGRSLADLRAEIERRAKAKVDVVASTAKVAMFERGDDQRLLIGADYDCAINQLAHRQIGEYLGIPAKYYDKIREKAPDLLRNNVNEWFHRFPAPRLVRMLDGNARAFLSDSYQPLENEDLAMATLPPLEELGLDIMSCEITDRRLYIKAVEKTVTRELEAKGGKFGDGRHNIVRLLSPAITISNSEVGEGALSVLVGVYDGFCSNLATFGERSVRKYHVGAKMELGSEMYALLSDETKRKTDAATWAQIGDVVRNAFQKATFDALCDKIAETQTQRIEGDVVKVVKFGSRRFGFTEAEERAVQHHLIEGADLSRFGLYNAITRAAQDVESYDRATEMERIGGLLIEMPANDWREIAAAA